MSSLLNSKHYMKKNWKNKKIRRKKKRTRRRKKTRRKTQKILCLEMRKAEKSQRKKAKRGRSTKILNHLNWPWKTSPEFSQQLKIKCHCRWDSLCASFRIMFLWDRVADRMTEAKVESLKKRLRALTESANCIETCSLWLLHHKKVR